VKGVGFKPGVKERGSNLPYRREREQVSIIQWVYLGLGTGVKRLVGVMGQCEGWINEASQFLLTIGRKATDCKRSQDAVALISQLNQFKEDGATKQNDRLNDMERIATSLYGQ